MHAELCGSKYPSSISHTQKISDLLDKINTAMISDMAVDCVCCESLDAISSDFLYLSINNILLSKASLTLENMFSAPSVDTLISYHHHARAPPIV